MNDESDLKSDDYLNSNSMIFSDDSSYDMVRPKSAMPRKDRKIDDITGIFAGGIKVNTFKAPKMVLLGCTVDESSTDDVEHDKNTQTNKKKKEPIEKLYLETQTESASEESDAYEIFLDEPDTNFLRQASKLESSKQNSTLTNDTNNENRDDLKLPVYKPAKVNVKFGVVEEYDHNNNEQNDEHTNNGAEMSNEYKNKIKNSPIFRLLKSNNSHAFVLEPAPISLIIKCRIFRRKGLFSEFRMCLERDDENFLDLMIARKKTAGFVISALASDRNDNVEIPIAKLKPNLLGTQFVLSGIGKRLNIGTKKSKNDDDDDDNCVEYAGILYELNILGMKGPRQMTVIVPGMDANGFRKDYIPQNEDEYIINAHNKMLKMKLKGDENTESNGNLVTLVNKKPIWNEELKCHTLDFSKRVTVTSVKNFQIVHPSRQNYVIMQFGRTEKDSFTCDYSYPFCALQAFSVALSSLDTKIGCE